MSFTMNRAIHAKSSEGQIGVMTYNTTFLIEELPISFHSNYRAN